MTITININDLTLCHKGSGGVSSANLPDVCNTPPLPAPIPYPNVSFSSDLAKGTKTVFADGGNSCANLGSEFFKSTGDEPGVAGGIASGVNMKESTWITFSFDVKLEGKNACRLTDKKFQNHLNTVDLAGLIQKPISTAQTAIECILGVLCKNDRDVVAKLKRIDITVTDPEPVTVMKRGSGGWDAIPATRGGYSRGGKNAPNKKIVVTRSDCNSFVQTLYHEFQHSEQTDAQRASKKQADIDVRNKTEQWAIDRGLPKARPGSPRMTVGGKEVVDTGAIQRHCDELYSESAATPSDWVRGPYPPGVDPMTATEVEVVDNGTGALGHRTARPGDSYVKSDPSFNGHPEKIDPNKLKCP